ncbi:hypothetical protein [Burkholderia sp. PAMC 26561]|uniref:hypothetical protein n=1 Tax=Burkholderia sp. PAMC 26561 TaxID=1795043 RepID=UPI00076B5A85|nr:hypothetical protein [Burkholderia sp. PAMC 26561]AME26937.1 hypothetical protein AXG89_23470 [Burkholderia sp. PAMC 26561]AME27917.1 hypothetical protein AXG89_29215 [Burkholderia sp. PAMC 26561]
MTPIPDHENRATAIIEGRHFNENDIQDAELNRARHALAYLKRKLGNEAMRALLDDDLRTMHAQVRQWVQASSGQWRTASVELIVPGPGAHSFQDWYVEAMANKREAELRAGHPEHFVSHPLSNQVEVIENIGETELPWRVFYRGLPDDFVYPAPWDPSYALHYGMEILDADGVRVGFSMRQSRDIEEGLNLKFTTVLPSAVPEQILSKHLNHFAVEFRNWTRIARERGNET